MSTLNNCNKARAAQVRSIGPANPGFKVTYLVSRGRRNHFDSHVNRNKISPLPRLKAGAKSFIEEF
jgi:hypothetical protein